MDKPKVSPGGDRKAEPGLKTDAPGQDPPYCLSCAEGRCDGCSGAGTCACPHPWGAGE